MTARLHRSKTEHRVKSDPIIRLLKIKFPDSLRSFVN